LDDPRITEDHERDLIYDRLFHCAQLFYQRENAGAELMQRAAVEVKDEVKK
jgi:hypothetical protein